MTRRNGLIVMLVAVMIACCAVPMHSRRKGEPTATEQTKSGKSTKSSSSAKSGTSAKGSKSAKSASKDKSAGKSAGKNAGKSANASKGSAGKKGAKGSNSGATSGKKQASKGKKETSADVRKQQEATRREIKLTEQQIKENDAAVKKNLTELGKLEGDIDVSKQKVAAANAKVTTLEGQINNLQGQIKKDQKELARLRAEYLKAVKKMRVKKQGKSTLAFIFSANSFNEGLRRMRYLKQFSEWREKQTGNITARVAQMRGRTEQLTQTKTMHDRELQTEVKARNELQAQYVKQDAIVTDLKRNGQALQAHLAKKQQEANALNGRVAALIAEEQRKAEADRIAREKAEAERKARLEQERLARQEAAEKAERERAERERQALAQAEAKEKAQAAKEKKQESKGEKKADNKQAGSGQLTAQTKTKEEPTASTRRRKSSGKKESGVAVPETKSPTDGDVTYAQARKRKPKGKPSATGGESATKGETKSGGPVASASGAGSASASASSSAGSGFAGMKGSLPRPVAGSFKVTSRFGRQTLPDLPDVSYDNPGIDAEVAAGASAQAVYGGKVSGVYMVPGYSTVVIVNHGGYYTVYGNISQSGVKVGDMVKQGQSLGRLAANEDDPSHSSIHFEVWKNREKMDPMGWIR